MRWVKTLARGEFLAMIKKNINIGRNRVVHAPTKRKYRTRSRSARLW